MVRDKDTKVLLKDTIEGLTNELGPLRNEVETLRALLQAKNAQVERLENVVTTFQSFFNSQQVLVKTPELAGETKQ